jgi:arginine deiminase
MSLHVDSQVGRLRQVIVHQPGLELSRLTPGNVEELLFDDILWASRPARSTTPPWGRCATRG